MLRQGENSRAGRILSHSSEIQKQESAVVSARALSSMPGSLYICQRRCIRGCGIGMGERGRSAWRGPRLVRKDRSLRHAASRLASVG